MKKTEEKPITGELTFEQMLNMQMSVFKLCTQDITASGVRYKLGKISKHFIEEIKNYEDARLPLLKKYADKVEETDGKDNKKLVWKVRPEDDDEYQEKLQPLLKTKVPYSFMPIDLRGVKLEKPLSGTDEGFLEIFYSPDYLVWLQSQPDPEEPKKKTEKKE